MTLAAMLLVPAAAALDRLVGDPRAWFHPVQAMGAVIGVLRSPAEAWAGDRPGRLRLAGMGITLVVVGGSAASGWVVERLAESLPPVGLPLLLVGLASALAGRSLEQAVDAVLAALPNATDAAAPAVVMEEADPLEPARERLRWIVGREVDGLPEGELLRAAAETAAENAVDGLFAPLFWMLAGAVLMVAAPEGTASPGPLALAWAFKAASTLDSMLGYRHGRLRWLGTAGARLDDLLVWLPARLVALSLPLAAGRPGATAALWRAALAEGAADPSPNAGVSQAAFAHAAGVRLGGLNRYAGGWRRKPMLAAAAAPPDRAAVGRILALSRRLELLWLLAGTVLVGAVSAFSTAGAPGTAQ
ncbi:cobalamin biosynthesis protein [Cyanobium sp. FGCU-52]|nr:cobalamin biosynthesis protein [Cyanobium sp. FGCU52]